MSTCANQSEQLVLERLSSEDPAAVRSAAFEAGDMGLESALGLLVQHIHSPNPGIQEAAEDALRKIRGTAVVSAVAPLLRSEDASVRNSAMDILREISSDDIKAMQLLVQDSDPDIRIFAADILGTSESPMAVAILSEALFTDTEVNVRYQICISLGELGFPEAAGTLSKALKDEEWVQFAAVEALAKIRADSCADILINALRNCSELVASTIITALGEMGNVRAVPILLQRLDEASGPLRNKTVMAIVQILGAPSLGLFAPKDLTKFRTYLLVALTDEDEDIIEAALTGLSGVGVGSVEASRAVLKLIERLDPMRGHDLVLLAQRCLASIGYTEGLHEGLLSGNDQVVQAVVEACGSIGCRRCIGLIIEQFFTFNRDLQRLAIYHLAASADKTDVSFFMEVLEQAEDPQVIKEALSFVGQQALCTVAAPQLLHFLEHADDDVKEAALDACLAMQSPEVNAQLTGLFSSRNPLMRLMATYSMGRIDATQYLNDLSVALEDEIPDIRKVALESIGGICANRPELLTLLAPRLSDESREVRLALVELIGQIDTVQSTELLVQALSDEDNWVRIRAIESLGARRITKVLPTLVQMLDGSDLLVVLKIIEALGSIGGKMAFRALLSLTGHSDPDIQSAVSEAIAHIREEQGEDI
ncbi:MAG: HEAT repeat domain-containing protein [Bilophila sp.]